MLDPLPNDSALTTLGWKFLKHRLVYEMYSTAGCQSGSNIVRLVSAGVQNWFFTSFTILKSRKKIVCFRSKTKKFHKWKSWKKMSSWMKCLVSILTLKMFWILNIKFKDLLKFKFNKMVCLENVERKCLDVFRILSCAKRTIWWNWHEFMNCFGVTESAFFSMKKGFRWKMLPSSHILALLL